MPQLEPFHLLLLLVLVAYVAFRAGKASAGAGSPEDRVEREMRQRQKADQLFSGLAPQDQMEIDNLLHEKKTIQAVKRLREKADVGLKEAKEAIDARQAAMGQV